MKLPNFRRTPEERASLKDKTATARLIQALWTAAAPMQRQDPAFIVLLVQCGWTNVRAGGKGWGSTRIWRNRNCAHYLGVVYTTDGELASTLSSRFPSIKYTLALRLVRMHTGITHYRPALRPATLKFVKQHAKPIAAAFELVSSKRVVSAQKIKRAVDMIASLGDITIHRRRVSPLNCITPTLACLDPARRFPIMNARTQLLLRAIGEKQDSNGALELHKLIGRNDVKNALELDAYAYFEDFSKLTRQPGRLSLPLGPFASVGLKSEVASWARIVKNQIQMRKQHNRLTNQFINDLKWRRIVARESKFDAVILDWKKGRHLLIEAKTASEGPGGRAQIRQAIGQLFDYRLSYFAHKKVDLAVLLPSKPSDYVQSLLATLGIEVLWFERRQLAGTLAF
jgi:hypothetical protein